MNHPEIDYIERTGYPRGWRYIAPEVVISNSCDACNEYEAEVKLYDTKLCSECCKEEGITIL